MKEKFCYGCQNWRPESEGQVLHRNKSSRWVCQFCMKKMNQGLYKSKEKKCTHQD
jgi:phage antirepressor YoqD-like protein